MKDQVTASSSLQQGEVEEASTPYLHSGVLLGYLSDLEQPAGQLQPLLVLESGQSAVVAATVVVVVVVVVAGVVVGIYVVVDAVSVAD